MLINTVDFDDKRVILLFFPIIRSSVFSLNQRAIGELKKKWKLYFQNYKENYNYISSFIKQNFSKFYIQLYSSELLFDLFYFTLRNPWAFN